MRKFPRTRMDRIEEDLIGGAGIGAGEPAAGTWDHALLTHLAYADAAHTGFEPTIAAGTSAQYWRGDKTWQTLNQAAVAGLTVSDSPVFAGLTIGSLTGMLKAATGVVGAATITSPLAYSAPALSLAGLSSLGVANQIVGVNAGATAWEYKTLTQGTNITITHGVGTVTIAASGGAVAHNVLSATHTDSTAASAVRGDLITGQGASPVWARLAKGAAKTLLWSDGTDAQWAANVNLSGYLNVGSGTVAAWAGHIGASRLYLNSTAYLDGATAGAVILTAAAGGLQFGDSNVYIMEWGANNLAITASGGSVLFRSGLVGWFYNADNTAAASIKHDEIQPAAADTMIIGWTSNEIKAIYLGTGGAYFGLTQASRIYDDGTYLRFTRA